MTKLRSFAKNLSNFILGIACIGLVLALLLAGHLKTRLYLNVAPSKTEIVEWCIIHFSQNSIRSISQKQLVNKQNSYFDLEKITIQLEDKVYSFHTDSIQLGVDSSKRIMPGFIVRHNYDSSQLVHNNRITSIYLPLTRSQKRNLQQILTLQQSNKGKYFGFSLFDYQYSAIIAHILSEGTILNQFSRLEALLAFSTPKSLRNA